MEPRNDNSDFAASRPAQIAATPIRSGRARVVPPTVRPAVQRLVDGLVHAPAFVRNNRCDLLASNAMGRALCSTIYVESGAKGTVNTARFLFLSEKATHFFRDWDLAAFDIVGALRREMCRDPYDRKLQQLIGELSLRSREFSALWATRHVPHRDTGFASLHHPVVGDITLSVEVLDLASDPGQSLVVYGADPGSVSEESLRLLSTWQATTENGAWSAAELAP